MPDAAEKSRSSRISAAPMRASISTAKGSGIAVERRHAKAARAVINSEAFVENTLTIRQQNNDRVLCSHGVGLQERSWLDAVPSADSHISTFDLPGSLHCPSNPSGRCRVLRPNKRSSNKGDKHQAEGYPAKHGFREVRHRHSEICTCNNGICWIFLDLK